VHLARLAHSRPCLAAVGQIRNPDGAAQRGAWLSLCLSVFSVSAKAQRTGVRVGGDGPSWCYSGRAARWNRYHDRVRERG